MLFGVRFRRRQARAKQLAAVKEAAREDLVALADDVAELEDDVERDPDAKEDYLLALEQYALASERFDRARTPEQLEPVAKALDEGRYLMTRAKARLEGRALPERRLPCFFDPRHGPSVNDVLFTPPGGEAARGAGLRGRRGPARGGRGARVAARRVGRPDGSVLVGPEPLRQLLRRLRPGPRRRQRSSPAPATARDGNDASPDGDFGARRLRAEAATSAAGTAAAAGTSGAAATSEAAATAAEEATPAEEATSDGRQGESGRGARDLRRGLPAADRRDDERLQAHGREDEGRVRLAQHPDTDDFFLVVSGRLTIQLRDRDVELGPGDMYVVPRGVEHCPRSDEGAEILLIEPVGTVNTGDAEPGELTAPEQSL